MKRDTPTLREQTKNRIIQVYLWLSAISAVGIALLLTPFGVAALLPVVVTLACGITCGGFALLLWFRPHLSGPVMAFYLTQMMVALVALDFIIPGWNSVTPEGGMVALPTVAVFLIGRRWGVVFLGQQILGNLAMLLWADNPIGVLIDSSILVVIAGLLVALAIVAETLRVRAEDEADENERELEAAATQARAAAHAKGTFVATMSHEIRTPMNAVLGLTRLLLDSELDADQRQLARTALHAGESLLRVLNDILDLSRLDAGEVHLEAVAFDLHALCGDVHQLLSRDAEARGLELAVHVKDGVPQWVEGDPTRLRQVLVNLVGNALKFTHEGRVGLRVAAVPAGIEFQVVDTGVGIPEDRRASLFDPFVQADASTTRRFGGTGLGLAISKDIVRAMGGAIDVASEVDVGTTFTVRLPLRPAVAPQQDELHVPDPRGGAIVLVVDDNAVNRLVARRSLEALGLEVQEANDGEQAVEAVLATRFDLVLMDCFMPTMDGFDATRAIRARGIDSARLPIVALTASVTTEDRERVIEAGMDDLIAKPLEPRVLKQALVAYLGSDTDERLAG